MTDPGDTDLTTATVGARMTIIGETTDPQDSEYAHNERLSLYTNLQIPYDWANYIHQQGQYQFWKRLLRRSTLLPRATIPIRRPLRL